jgi:hypothetical protein
MSDLTQKCLLTGESFVVTEFEQGLLKRMDMPLPKLVLAERHRRRMAHRNERSIYQGQCGKCNKSIISLYSPDKNLTVYCQDCWWGDGWDSRDYGREFDFDRPFFDQFYELQQSVPRLALMNTKSENSDYCNITTNNKNCYLVFGGDFNEDCIYSVFNFYSKDSSDLYWVTHSELTYDCVDCGNCYNVKYSQNSYGCRDSSFLFGCRNVSNSFGCVGLRGKEYHIFNEPYSKAEYEKKIKSFRLDTWSGVQHMKQEFELFKLNFPHRAAQILKSERCTGDSIERGKNSINCFNIFNETEDLKDVICGGLVKDSLSSNHIGHNSELFYEMLGSIDGYKCAFSTFAWSCQEAYYCDVVTGSSFLFGCSNLKKAKHCILNKQYSENEYAVMKARVIEHMKKTGEWGLFFPMDKSMFAYNETVANDFFPLSKEEVEGRGFRWLEEEVREKGTGAVISDSIHDVTDDLVGEILVCEKTGRPYKLVPRELKLYRQLEVPVPPFAPETRNRIRWDQRNPCRLWTRSCDKCEAEIQTTYAPERPEKVFCEACYLKEVY